MIAAAALSAVGCFREFGRPPRDGPVPDASAADGAIRDGECDCRIDGACRADGELDPSDPCRECVPERAGDAWTDRCTHRLVETTFDDFKSGTMPRSLGNLYVSAEGAVRVVRSGDLNDDGFLDLVFSNQGDEGNPVNSYVYWGTASGFSAANRTELPTLRSAGASVADLDADGFQDLVFSNFSDGAANAVDSYIYWGGPTGFSTLNRTELPTIGAYSNTVADLDGNGFLDIVFCSRADEGWGTPATESHVYWGSAIGFAPARRTNLATNGAMGMSAGDFDGDGFLDLSFANHSDVSSVATDSYVYWGSAAGFTRRTGLPTLGAAGTSVADLNDDGFIDLIFANHFDGSSYGVLSYVYLGSEEGFSESNRVELPTVGAVGASVADLDDDGFLDLVFSNWGDAGNHATDSFVYWGSADGFDESDGTELPTLGSSGNLVADFDGDGFLDIAFSNVLEDAGFALDSYVYWGSADGFSVANRTDLPTVGADVGMTTDFGNVYDRRPEEEYISSVLDLGEHGSPTAIGFDAETPLGSSVRLRIRTAPDLETLTAAPWLGPAGGADAWYERPFARLPVTSAGHRYLQYRAVLVTPGFVGRPALHSVTVHWECTLAAPGCCADSDCDDGDRCTLDRCAAGSCEHETPECCDDADCEDDDDCTRDRCEAGSCVHEIPECCVDSDCPDMYSCAGGACACGPDSVARLVDGQCLPSCGLALERAGFADTGGNCCATACQDSETETTFDCQHCCEDIGPWGTGCT